MIDMPQEYGWATVAVMVLGAVVAYLARWWKRKDEQADIVKGLMQERAQALREGRLTDAAALNGRIRRMMSLIAACVILISVSGCQTVKPGPVVIGERVYLPKPGESLVVPPLIVPAGQWYLIDDVSLDRLGFAPR
jgi:hypothetical protein